MLWNSVNSKEIPENKNTKKVVDIVLKILDFNKQQNGKGIKILKLQRLPIALAQIKAGSRSENVLNGIRQITYSLYRDKEVTKIVYNNIMNSIKF